MARTLLGLLLLIALHTTVAVAQQQQRASFPMPRFGSVLLQGLTDWWMVSPTFNGGLAPWRNLVNGRPNGTLNGMALAGSTTSGYQHTTNRLGGAGEMAFDGTDDYVDFGAVPGTSTTGVFTVTYWIKPVATSGGTMLSKADTGGANYVWSMAVDGSGGGGFSALAFTCAGSSGAYVEATYTFTTGQWYFVSWVYQHGISSELFINGSSVGITTTFPGAWCAAAATPVHAGRRADAVQYSNITIDDLRFYNRPLSAPLLRAIYLDALQGYPLTLIGRSPDALASTGAAPTGRNIRRGRIY